MGKLGRVCCSACYFSSVWRCGRGGEGTTTTTTPPPHKPLPSPFLPSPTSPCSTTCRRKLTCRATCTAQLAHHAFHQSDHFECQNKWHLKHPKSSILNAKKWHLKCQKWQLSFMKWTPDRQCSIVFPVQTWRKPVTLYKLVFGTYTKQQSCNCNWRIKVKVWWHINLYKMMVQQLVFMVVRTYIVLKI